MNYKDNIENGYQPKGKTELPKPPTTGSNITKNNCLTRRECLESAQVIVCGEREEQYGSPEDNFKTIADLWSVYLGTEVDAGDVAMMMALLKIARIKGGNYKADSFIDLAGYAACGCEIANG